jgi:hypothetical protein
MSSTSTNKQPLMVDRPFLRGAKVNNGTTVVTNTSSPDFGDLIQLVRVGDLPSEDGALVEDIFVVSGDTEGLIQRVELPATVAPTPQTGDTNLVRPIEIGKSEALYLEKGYILCVGYLGNGPAAVSGGLSASGLSIFAQGGFY